MGKKKAKRSLEKIGIIIKVNRLLNGLSLAALADGICEVDKLASIESEAITPNRKLVKQLFARMNLVWDIDEARLARDYRDIVSFNKDFMFNEFDITNKFFSNLENRESVFLASAYVLDYLIAKLCFESVQNRQCYLSLKSVLSTVTEYMNRSQKYNYYLCLGIDKLKVMKDIKMVETYFCNAAKQYNSGELKYWRAYMHLKEKHPIRASKYIAEAMAMYLEETNIVGIISGFEMKGLISYSTSEYVDGIKEYKKALEFAACHATSPYIANIKNMIAWGYMRMGDYEMAEQYIVNDRYNSDNTVNASVTKFLIALHRHDNESLSDLEEEFSYRNRSFHRMIYAILQKDEYFDKGKWLISDDEMDALFEFAQYTHFELEKAFAEIAIRHYKEKGDYQKALQYINSLSAEQNNLLRG